MKQLELKKYKTVFLVGDIGSDDNDSIHIGDEAMFIANLDQYLQQNIKVIASTRKITKKYQGFTQCKDIEIENYFKFLFYLAEVTLYKFLGRKMNNLQKVYSSDLIHISGGGNLNSFWPGHIYYRCLIMYIGFLYKIPVIMTSQTIGPNLRILDMITLALFLKIPKAIGIRDIKYSSKLLISLGILDYVYMEDDAVSLKKNINKPLVHLRKNRGVKIGISIHNWNLTQKDISKIKKLLFYINDNFPDITFYIIPHLISKNSDDVSFMSGILKGIDKKRIINTSDLMNKNLIRNNIPIYIKSITGEMDYVITSRYHGVIFSIMNKVPVLALNYDRYYQVKNCGALSIYLKNFNDFTLNINKTSDKSILKKVDGFLHQNNLFNPTFSRKNFLKLSDILIKINTI